MSSSAFRSTQFLRYCCLALIVIGLFAAAYNLTRRIHAESSSRAVDVVVDYQQLTALAASQGVSLDSALAQMKKSGATSVALSEETLQSLKDQGKLVFSGKIGWANIDQFLPDGWAADDPAFSIITSDSTVRTLVITGLMRVYQRSNLVTTDSGIIVRGDLMQVSTLGLGLAADKIARIQRAGLRVVPRLEGEANISAQAISDSMEEAHYLLARQQHTVVIFAGSSVLGYHELIPQVAEALQKNHLLYGMLEGGEQRGDVALGRALKGQLLRAHSISNEELVTMTTARAKARYALAVKDRNIRVVYIGFPPQASNAPLDSAGNYLQNIVSEIAAPGTGFTASPSSPARPFSPLSTPNWLLALLGCGAAGALLLWLLNILPRRLPQRIFVIAAGCLLLIVPISFGMALLAPTTARTIFGLLAALAFPLLSLSWAYQRLAQMPIWPSRWVIVQATATLIISTLITLLGGLLIAASYTSTMMMVKLGQFSGVKAALILPLLIFAFLAITDAMAKPGETFELFCKHVLGNINAILQQPLKIWMVLLGLLLAGLAGYMLLRSGNAGRETALNIELLVRARLETLLEARPRTKEFALGFPLFLLSMAAASYSKRNLAVLLLIGAGIGQVDVLNTFCHAHSPILLSLMRTGNALWLGTIIGIVAIFIFAFIFAGKFRNTASPAVLLTDK